MRLLPDDIYPEGWVILQYQLPDEDEIIYKIFASWREEDRWRLSSACVPKDLTDDGDYWRWVQESGSVYYLPKDEEGGSTFYTQTQMNLKIKIHRECGAKIKRVNIDEVLALKQRH